jgi:1-acyl-sn-glycerol-3-phosphate acyltransferase
VVLLSKHQSAWETMAYVALMPKPLCFVFKRELLFVPFFGWALGMLKMVHINRKDGTRASRRPRQGRERLAEGAWIIMFRKAPARRPAGKAALQERRRAPGRGNRRMGHPDGGQFGPPLARNSFLKYPGMITISIGARSRRPTRRPTC